MQTASVKSHSSQRLMDTPQQLMPCNNYTLPQSEGTLHNNGARKYQPVSDVGSGHHFPETKGIANKAKTTLTNRHSVEADSSYLTRWMEEFKEKHKVSL